MKHAWGKIDLNTGNFHALAHHSGDVAAVLMALFEQPVFHRRAEVAAGRSLNDVDCSRLGALAFMHDIGKLAPGFQAKGWSDELWTWPKVGHLTAGWQWCASLDGRINTGLNGTLPDILQWTGGEDWISMLLAHHGRPVPESAPEYSWRRLPHYDWIAEEEQMGMAMKAWFQIAFESNGFPLPTSQRFRHFFGGALALADWVGSDVRAFHYVPDFDIGYWKSARETAESRLRAIGLDVQGRRTLCQPGFCQLTGYEKPNTSQAEVGRVSTKQQLLILEAETGSGKTEAALWRYLALHTAREVEGLYFAVPTRAAARQLHHRIDIALKRVFGNGAETVLAIPGQIESGQVSGRRLTGWSVLWDDDETVEHPNRWSAEHAIRYLASEVAVGTVDQAMLAALTIKHAHLRGFALSRSLLVIDEVHASDSYMRRIQQKLLTDHLEVGGHAMLMSATLGAVARSEFLGSHVTPPHANTIQAAYPAVWVKGETDARRIQDSGRNKAVNVTAVMGWSCEEAARISIEKASRGARVLVIRNTVVRAQETFEAACQLNYDLVMRVNGGAALHHSRFAAEDRSLLDQEVEKVLGKASMMNQGCVVIGTQTLEQSLDIDADFLVTDLCPMDVLLQRIGRLHRHSMRERPYGFNSAEVRVLCPEKGLGPLTEEPENGLGSYGQGPLSGVYVDIPGLQATLDEISRHAVWNIPSMNRALVEAATHPDVLEKVAQRYGWQNYQQKLSGMQLAQIGLASNVILDRTKKLPDKYPNDEERIKTRLGEEGAVFDLPERVTGPFGEPVQRFALPAHWSRGITGKEECVKLPGIEFAIDINGRRFSYTRMGLLKL
ncbi:MAG: CRISPR-associated helicase Cas3' [Gammaproteobacteria bacterium]|nr:CRISPR-associated helicase Cas3' [Gammaproteobacteria bacterium]